MRNINSQLLAKTQQQILAAPARFNIEDFDTDIAAFTIAAAGMNASAVDTFTEARKALRISRGDMQVLCLLHLWPRKFRQRFEPEPSSKQELKQNATIAAARIAHFARSGC